MALSIRFRGAHAGILDGEVKQRQGVSRGNLV